MPAFPLATDISRQRMCKSRNPHLENEVGEKWGEGGEIIRSNTHPTPPPYIGVVVVVG